MPKPLKDLVNAFSAVELVLLSWMTSFTLIIVLDDKGGVGKSVLAQVATLLLKFFDLRVAVGDTDTHNSTSAQVSENAHMLDLGEKTAQGRLFGLLKSVDKGTIDHVVIDVGAREEAEIKALLPWLVQAVAKLGGRIVVLRPITLGSHNQRNACAFVDFAQTLCIPVVFVRNQSQGRRPEYFDRWLDTKMRSEALEHGAVETVLTDADVRYADEAVGFSLSFAECALQDWSKLEPRDSMTDAERLIAEKDVADATAFFDDDVAAFLGEWLRINMHALGTAIEEAIDKRGVLDAAAEQDEEPQPRKGKKK